MFDRYSASLDDKAKALAKDLSKCPTSVVRAAPPTIMTVNLSYKSGSSSGRCPTRPVCPNQKKNCSSYWEKSAMLIRFVHVSSTGASSIAMKVSDKLVDNELCTLTVAPSFALTSRSFANSPSNHFQEATAARPAARAATRPAARPAAPPTARPAFRFGKAKLNSGTPELLQKKKTTASQTPASLFHGQTKRHHAANHSVTVPRSKKSPPNPLCGSTRNRGTKENLLLSPRVDCRGHCSADKISTCHAPSPPLRGPATLPTR